MNQANDDLTISEVLADPMIRTMMRADGVTPAELRALLYSAADALSQTEPGTKSAKTHTANMLAAPKRRLLAMVHPLAVFSNGPCTANF